MLVYRHLIAVSIGAIITLGGSLEATSQESLSSEGQQTVRNVPTLPQPEEIIPPDSNFSMSKPELPMAPFQESLQGKDDYINPFLQIPVNSSASSELPTLDFLELLNPSANPLLFPTEADEVRVENIQPISLEQAIELARDNNRDLEEAILRVESSREGVRETLASEYPTISTQLDFTRSDSANSELSLRRSPLFGMFTGDDDTVSTVFDGRLEVNYDLFTSGRRSAQIKAAEEQLRLNQLDLERTAEQIRFEATEAYYDLQEADAQVTIAVAAVEQAQASLRNTALRERFGLGTRFEVLQDETQLAEAKQNLTLARSQQNIAQRSISLVLGLGQKVGVSAGDPITTAGEWDLSLEDSIVLALKNRAELEQELIRRNISDQQRRIALSGIRPQASLFANYNILGVLDDNLGPADGLTIGARLRWTLFDGGAANARAEQEQKNIEISENRFDNQRNQIRLEVERGYYNLLANKNNISTAGVAVRAAEERLRLARLRLQEGVGIKSDEISAQSELTRARNNLLRAFIDYNRALSSLQRAVTNLPDGKLFDLP
ncbi:MAG: TolC family protein [Spirulinaceae cyanobacterium]